MEWWGTIRKEDTKNKPLRYRFPKIRTTLSFHAVVLLTTAKKCTKIQNARAQPFFCSLNFLFGEDLVAVIVVVCCNSLFQVAHYSTVLYTTQTLQNSNVFYYKTKSPVKLKRGQ